MPPRVHDPAAQKVHRRRADEARHEPVRRLHVDVVRRIELLDDPILHHRDAVGQRQRLDLVVGDIDHRCLEPLVQPLDLDAQFGAQLGVEIGERLVEQEHAGVAHQRAADGDALALAAGQFRRPAVEQLGDLQHRSGGVDALLDLRRRHAGDPQAERHVAAHGHARIERIGLEHHRDAAVLRLLPGDVAPADPDLPGIDVEQAGDGVEQGRLAAAGRPEQHDEFGLRDLEVELLQHADACRS